jgi:uncharacterized membrane protein YvlD (DUF360 family)
MYCTNLILLVPFAPCCPLRQFRVSPLHVEKIKLSKQSPGILADMDRSRMFVIRFIFCDIIIQSLFILSTRRFWPSLYVRGLCRGTKISSLISLLLNPWMFPPLLFFPLPREFYQLTLDVFVSRYGMHSMTRLLLEEKRVSAVQQAIVFSIP